MILPDVSPSCIIDRRNRSWSNKYTRALFLPLALMSPSFAAEVLFGNYHEYFYICVEFNCLEAKLSIIGWYCYLLPGHEYLSHNHSRDCTSTCEAIWESLRAAFMSQKSEKDWLRTADELFGRTNFPNCLGAVDGKHMCKPVDNGSLFFNYKNFFSTVLMALVVTDYCFISIVHLVTATSLRILTFVTH